MPRWLLFVGYWPHITQGVGLQYFFLTSKRNLRFPIIDFEWVDEKVIPLRPVYVSISQFPFLFLVCGWVNNNNNKSLQFLIWIPGGVCVYTQGKALHEYTNTIHGIADEKRCKAPTYWYYPLPLSIYRIGGYVSTCVMHLRHWSISLHLSSQHAVSTSSKF